MISVSEIILQSAAEICQNCPPQNLTKGISPVQTQPLSSYAGLFQFPLRHLLLSQGRSFCSDFNARDAPGLQIPTNSSHTSLESLQEESSAGLSQISHWVSSSFQGRNALPAASALLGRAAHFYEVRVTDHRPRKRWERNHRNHNARKLQSTEGKETSFQDV